MRTIFSFALILTVITYSNAQSGLGHFTNDVAYEDVTLQHANIDHIYEFQPKKENRFLVRRETAEAKESKANAAFLNKMKLKEHLFLLNNSFQIDKTRSHKITIEWSTSNALNIDRFEVVTTDNAGNEKVVRNQKASNAVTGFTKYQIKEDINSSGKTPYHIRVIDIYGNRVSTINREVFVGDAIPVNVYPKDTKNEIMIWSESIDLTGSKIHVFDGNGIIVKDIQLNPEQDQAAINLVDLPDGDYKVNITTKEKQFSQQVTKY